MRRGLLIIASSVIAIITVVFLLEHSRARDPIINGKPLSHWLMANYQNTGDSDANYEAIKTAGTNALPFLLEQIQQYQPLPRWKSKIIALSNAVLPAQAASAIQWRLSGYEGFAITCANAYSILGTNAVTAIPGLVNLATQKAPVERANLALFALGGIGKETIPFFSGIITNQGLPHRVQAISMLCSGVVTPYDSAQLLPIMNSCLHDPDPDVRTAAAIQIQRITAFLPNTNTPAQ
jgi:hypothetical protein